MSIKSEELGLSGSVASAQFVANGKQPQEIAAEVDETAEVIEAGQSRMATPAQDRSASPSSDGGEFEGPFTDDEIRTQLEALGYKNIPDYQLRLFKEDLEKLIWFEQDRQKTKPRNGSPSKLSEDGRDKLKKEPFATYKETTRKLGTRAVREAKPRQVPALWPKGRSQSPPTSDSSQSTRNQRWHRRKVLRHIRGEPVICEEPTDTDTDLTLISDRLSSLPLDDSENEGMRNRWGHDCPIVNAVVCKKSPSQRSSDSSNAIRKRLQRGVYYDEIIRYLPKSFVESEPFQPLKKCSPHQRFDMYRRMWNNCRIPGETPDMELRWCIRALLLTRKVPEVEIYAMKRKDAIDKARSIRQNRS